jgi:hypothetical protein
MSKRESEELDDLLDETESKYVPLKEKKKKIVISFFDSNK